MAAIGACLQLRGDWAQFVEILAVPNWKSIFRPCFKCNAQGADRMYNAQGCCVNDIVFHTNTDDEYERACSRCELSVTIPDKQTHRQIQMALRYDKRPSASKGREVTMAFPNLNPPLMEGDRVEPSDSLQDVADFDKLVDFPVVVAFLILLFSIS